MRTRIQTRAGKKKLSILYACSAKLSHGSLLVKRIDIRTLKGMAISGLGNKMAPSQNERMGTSLPAGKLCMYIHIHVYMFEYMTILSKKVPCTH